MIPSLLAPYRRDPARLIIWHISPEPEALEHRKRVQSSLERVILGLRASS